ncbi:MAG: aminotransferase class III-fold pyridoxal phosphate-dependent enzyme [Desulfobacteraceae bacterium]|uniref:Aminotransferase class III-fold pyridoxal phosphate-dependent enzyme n=1 Tax=Candidatus Desulfacyla euxinica TaxID=2841693 RepID=A0A8J6MZW7_9DELT|nr:aminotransferase class III-fold pyridoxal phosphate-dependent enzyme [Candidatus Desulfacyla euxinica]MBL6978306.1 aminotransferase class III-fold pyridoxal phosphate-dependent enzyme [Desulfobacteraceae bacterium]
MDLVVYCNGDLLATHLMPRAEVPPGDRVTIHFPLHAPDSSGAYKIVLELVAQNETRFSDQGVKPLVIKLRIDSPLGDRSGEIYEQASRINPWYYQPTRGIGQSADGHTYPLFVSKAKGCYVWDTEGRQYVDYVMGWGCSLLGYADERVQKAIADVLHSGAVVPFPYPLEMEVAQMLTEDIPCAEMVLFGKNGSDVCTASARMARVFTGRKKLLTCGYHGWQDFWVEKEGFAKTGVPDRPEILNHSFKFNDLDDFVRLFREHRDDLAAVMLEPSGPAESVQGPVQDADRDFLSAIAEMVREAGALLIFDEILTGYRYPSGSVQKATGIIPDLACFGKALACGMPLSALVGRSHIFQRAAENIHYGPTFKGEMYSFAAAKAAIQIYRDEPVAKHVWDYGTQLKRGINNLCNQVGIAARCLGPPFRTALTFDEPDPERLSLKRTLYLQELLKSGVTTYNGIMLPSYSHNNSVLETTLDVIGSALEKVVTAEQQDAFHRYLEIPLL